MPDITNLLTDALEVEARGTETWVSRDTIVAGAARSIARRRRTRAAAIASVAAAAVLASSAVALAAVRSTDPGPVGVPTTSAATPSPSPSAGASATPTPTADAALNWADVPDAEKPAWATDSAEGEPASRAMEPWVWDYVTDAWSLEVFNDEGDSDLPLASQVLLLRAPNSDLFRVMSLPTGEWASVNEWNPSERLAWVTFYQAGDSWRVAQADLDEGTLDSDWLPMSLADPYDRGWFEGVWDVGRVADLGGGRELWANFTYMGTYEGFFVREPDGAWTPMVGMDQAKAAVANGSTNGGMDSGVVAWFNPDEQSVAMLFQWGTYDDGTFTFHTSEAQWVVVHLDSSGRSAGDSVEVSERFVPTPVLCDQYRGQTTPNTTAPSGYTVTALCGSTIWELTPLTGNASAVGSVK